MKKSVCFALAALLALTLWGCGKKPQPTPSSPPSPAGTNRGEIIATASPEPEATKAPLATPEPSETFRPAPSETPAETPAPTAAPTEEPVIVNPNVLASGSFRSDTGTALNLVAEWRAVSVSEDTARMTVTLFLESYSLDIGERRSNLLTFNDEEYYFMTDPIEIFDSGFMKTQIYVWSREIPVSELSFTLSVRWNLLGSYSKKEMEALELSGSYEYRPSLG